MFSINIHSSEEGKMGTTKVTRYGRNQLKLLPILPRWRAIVRRVILKFNKELDRGSLIKWRTAFARMEIERNAARRWRFADINQISWYFISFDYEARGLAALSNLLSIFGERQFPAATKPRLLASDFHPFSTGGLHFYLQSTGSLARMAAQPFPHEEEIKWANDGTRRVLEGDVRVMY